MTKLGSQGLKFQTTPLGSVMKMYGMIICIALSRIGREILENPGKMHHMYQRKITLKQPLDTKLEKNPLGC